jgi:hypothetical protein
LRATGVLGYASEVDPEGRCGNRPGKGPTGQKAQKLDAMTDSRISRLLFELSPRLPRRLNQGIGLPLNGDDLRPPAEAMLLELNVGREVWLDH